MNVSRPFRLVATLALAASFVLAGCSDDQKSDKADHTHDQVEIHVSDAWVKAADSGMTAAFATLENDSEKALTITKVTSDASSDTQLH